MSAQFAAAARTQKAAEAKRLGIDDAVIATLVTRFYDKVRAHPELGPIFDRHVANWPVHLARMEDFWVSIAIEGGRYHGNPMAKHIAITGLSPTYFAAWLTLWREVTFTVLQQPAAAAFLQAKAEQIANSLQIATALHQGGLQALTIGGGHADH